MDLTVDGDTVLVDDGEYRSGGAVAPGASLSNRVYIDRAITLQSVNGAAHTSIRASSSFDVPYLVGNATLNHCVIFENRTMDDHARGVRGGTLNDCSIRNNFAGGTNSEGGGVSESTLNRCLVLNNSARFGAGAAFSTLNHCLVRGNQASASAGGVFFGTLNHCTVIENSAAEQAGGTGAAVVNNSIVYFNTAASSPNHGFCEFSHTCTTPLPSEGAGNIDSQPVFAGAANFRLAESSPCRDAGDNAQVVGGVDLDGKPRIYNDVTDMGCYELQIGEG